MAGLGLRSVVKQVASLREEECSEESWFVLPDEEDEEVNWLNFTVEIEGPPTYDVDPVPSSADASAGGGGAEGGASDSAGSRPSPYKGGLFRVEIQCEKNYPMSAPKVKFLTKVWHPNVEYESGNLCMDFLTTTWKSDMNLRHVLIAVRSLLANPNPDDNVNSEAAKQMKDGIEVFEKQAAADTTKYAMW